MAEWKTCKKHFLKFNIDYNYGECPACAARREHMTDLFDIQVAVSPVEPHFVLSLPPSERENYNPFLVIAKKIEELKGK